MRSVFNYHGEWFYDDETPSMFKVRIRRIRRKIKNIFSFKLTKEIW